jgi:hypothetical protein
VSQDLLRRQTHTVFVCMDEAEPRTPPLASTVPAPITPENNKNVVPVYSTPVASRQDPALRPYETEEARYRAAAADIIPYLQPPVGWDEFRNKFIPPPLSPAAAPPLSPSPSLAPPLAPAAQTPPSQPDHNVSLPAPLPLQLDSTPATETAHSSTDHSGGGTSESRTTVPLPVETVEQRFVRNPRLT